MDNQLGTRLKELGVSSNKTYGWIIPEIPMEYISHFIRGLFDGDGSFNLCNKKHGPSCRLVAYDINLLEELIEIIIQQVPSVKNHIRIYNYDNRIPELNISSKQSVKDFLDWLYDSATIYLNRKYEKYLGFAVSGTNREDS